MVMTLNLPAIVTQCGHVMSLHSRWADAIYAGGKSWEFRRGAPRLVAGDQVAIYETAPTRLITGVFNVGHVRQVRSADIDQLLALETNPEFRAHLTRYLAGAEVCCAFEIRQARRLGQPLHLHELGMTRGPMSYQRLIRRS